jgi:hypothetical protein
MCRPGEEIYHFEEPAARGGNGAKAAGGDTSPAGTGKTPPP